MNYVLGFKSGRVLHYEISDEIQQKMVKDMLSAVQSSSPQSPTIVTFEDAFFSVQDIDFFAPEENFLK